MKHTEFEQLVRDMRGAQKSYFRLRREGSPQPQTMETLEHSKHLEKRVDDYLKTDKPNPNPQTSLL